MRTWSRWTIGVVGFVALASCHRSRPVVVETGSCARMRPAAPRAALPAPAPGEIRGVVDMPWAGAVSVDLDAPAQRAAVDESGRFVLTHVPPGQHVLVMRAVGFIPQRDTVDVDAQGAVVMLHPRVRAACLL